MRLITEFDKMLCGNEIVLPDAHDKCGWWLISRTLSEMRNAPNANIRTAKEASLHILLTFGWRDVFKESLDANGNFKSHEEAARFKYCNS